MPSNQAVTAQEAAHVPTTTAASPLVMDRLCDGLTCGSASAGVVTAPFSTGASAVPFSIFCFFFFFSLMDTCESNTDASAST